MKREARQILKVRKGNARSVRHAPQRHTVTDLRLLLIGSGGFGVPAFDALHEKHGESIAAVITAAPRPSGRGGALVATPVASWAREHDLPLLEVERLRTSSTQETIASLEATVGLLADFGQIIPAEMLRSVPRGILNLHPSLLPAYRGAAPIPAAILAGDQETGVSTILMDDGLDTGPLLAVTRHPLRGDEDAPHLEAQLAQLAADGIVETLERYLAGEIVVRAQPTAGVSLTRRLQRSDGEILATWTAEYAHRAWRAYRPWPGVWISLTPALERLKLDVIGLPVAEMDVPLGGLLVHEEVLFLGLKGGALPLLEVTPMGGRRMNGAALIHGRPELLAPHARIRT
jgi:methionyl-tRNA formyltransferase